MEGDAYGEVAIPVPGNFRAEWEIWEEPPKNMRWCNVILRGGKWETDAALDTNGRLRWSCDYFRNDGNMFYKFRGEISGGEVGEPMPEQAGWHTLAVEKIGRIWVVELDGQRSTTSGVLPADAVAPEKRWLHMNLNAGTRIRNVKVFNLDKEAGELAAGLRFRYYPSLGKLVCVLYSNLPDAVSGGVLVRDAQGREVFRKEGLPLAAGLVYNGSAQTEDSVVDLPELPDGEYTVAAGVRTADGKEFWTPSANKIIRKHYPWEGNTLGITDEVLSPLHPRQGGG